MMALVASSAVTKSSITRPYSDGITVPKSMPPSTIPDYRIKDQAPALLVIRICGGEVGTWGAYHDNNAATHLQLYRYKSIPTN